MRLFSRACWGWREAQTDDDLSILSKNRHRYPTAATMMRKSLFTLKKETNNSELGPQKIFKRYPRLLSSYSTLSHRPDRREHEPLHVYLNILRYLVYIVTSRNICPSKGILYVHITRKMYKFTRALACSKDGRRLN